MIFNQPQYAVGDTAYFSVAVPDKRIARAKTVLTLRLKDGRGDTFFYKRIILTNGFGWSYLRFPDQMTKGIYTMAIIPETSQEGEASSYSINWLVSDNGTIVRLKDSLPIESCSQLALQVNSAFRIRDKVTAEINTSGTVNLQNIVIVGYNKGLFADFDNGINFIPDIATRDPANTSVRNPYYFRGRVFMKFDNKPAPDSTSITFYLRNNNLIYEVFTRKGGYFEFPLFKDFDDDWVFYKTTRKGNPIDCIVELEDLYVNPNQRSFDSTNYRHAYASYSRIRKAVEDSYNYFKTGDDVNVYESYENDIEADINVSLGKYEPFNSMYEVFLNVVPMVKLRLGETDQIRVFLKRIAGYGMTDPLYIVNGYMTDKTDFIVGLDPRKLKRIGVLRTDNTLGRFGELGQNGIIIVEADLTNEVVPSNNNLFIKGVAKSEMNSTVKELDSRSPDLRSSVFWWADSKLPYSGNFSFYTSNAPGPYAIHVFATIDDKLCSIKHVIDVSGDK
ncbi:MAG: hypothetical protein KIT62_00905 [Cyclobacteriaceae bacterium]|nr:hypothetical protein [Cyclobacteriaceae bacterium]